jgi:rod shape-determining protein MreB
MVEYLRSSFLKPDIAIDIGTAWVRVAYGAAGLHAVPSLFEGRNALRAGVIIDRDAVTAILRPLLKRVRRFGVLPPRVVACVPSDVTSKEHDTVRECVLKSGAANVCIVPEPLAAAIGGGLDVASPFASMILDIGEGVTDCAVIRSGKVIDMHASRVGCAELRRAVIKAASRHMGQFIDRNEADRLLRRIDVGNPMHAVLPGNVAPVRPDEDVYDWSRYREALEPFVEKILGVAQAMWRQIKPSLGCEIIENGIWLSDGGSMMKGMASRLEDATRIKVNTVANPLEAVVRGAHAMLPIITILNGWTK